jgi:hypothetical protein
MRKVGVFRGEDRSSRSRYSRERQAELWPEKIKFFAVLFWAITRNHRRGATTHTEAPFLLLLEVYAGWDYWLYIICIRIYLNNVQRKGGGFENVPEEMGR